MTASAIKPQAIDNAQARRFLKLLGKDPATTRLRAFPAKKSQNKKAIGARSGDFDLQLAKSWNDCRGVYVVINDGKDTKDSITACRALFVEWDDQPIGWQLTAWQELGLPEPTVIVSTGRSAHTYWVLKETISPERWEPLLKRLIAYCKSDPSCNGRARVMRLPGFWYIDANDQPTHPVQIVEASGHRYTAEEIEACLPPEQPKAQLVEVAPPTSKVVPIRRSADAPQLAELLPLDALKTWQQGVGEGNRNDTTFMLAAALMALEAAATAEGLPYTGTAEEAVRDFASRCSPPVDDSEVEQTIKSARSQPRTVDPNWPNRLDFHRRRLQRNTSAPAPTGRTEASKEPAPRPASFLDLIHSLPPGWQPAAGGGVKPANLAPGPLSLMLPAALLRFNEMELMAELHTTSGWQPISETDLDSAYVVLSQKGWKIALEPVTKAVLHVARQNTFHPVRAYLEALEQRNDIAPFDLDQVAPRFFRASDPLHVAMVRAWLIGAVARALQPGCQMDYALVLQGKQGIRKSRTFEALASGDWFCSTVPDQDKDLLLNIHSCWIFELAELESVTNRRESGHLKNLITTPTDRVRVPYGRASERKRRPSVFCGTVNNDDFLRDPTGNRRYWVVPIEGDQLLDTSALKQARDGIWKAAVIAWRNGELPMLKAEQAQASEEQNTQFHERDPWHDAVERFLYRAQLEQQLPVKAGEVLDRLQVPVAQQNNHMVKRIRTIAEQLGWEHARKRANGGRAQQGFWPSAVHPAHPVYTPTVHPEKTSDANGSAPLYTPLTPKSEKGGQKAGEQTKKPAASQKDDPSVAETGCTGCTEPQTPDAAMDLRGVQPGCTRGERGERGVRGVRSDLKPWEAAALAMKAGDPAIHAYLVVNNLAALGHHNITPRQIKALFKAHPPEAA